MPEKVIVDASVLIALEKIGLLDILCKLYNNVILPEAVISEFGTHYEEIMKLKDSECKPGGNY
jgi:predicted nucleic acid-binding protein